MPLFGTDTEEGLVGEADEIVRLADEAGQRHGLPKGGLGSLEVLTRALAVSIVQAANFGDDPMRLPSLKQTMVEEITKHIDIQFAVRRGIIRKGGVILGR